MAVTKITYSANGSQTQFNIPFEYIAEADVDVYIDTVLQLQQNTTSTAAADHPQVVSGDITQGTALTNYTFANATTIEFNSAPDDGAFIYIERTTDDSSIVTFTSGSTIRASELNTALEQVRFIAQEGTNTAQDGAIPSKDNAASMDAQGKRLENLADANSDDDAVTRAQLGKVITDDLVAGNAITLTDATGGTNSNKQVTVAVTDGEIDTAELADSAVTTAKINDSAVTSDKIADGTIVNADINASADIAGSKLADNSVDLDKIVDADVVETSDYNSAWASDDTKIATVGSLAARHDVVVNTDVDPPSTAQAGKQWLSTAPGNQTFKIYDGSGWRTVAVGQPYSPATTTIVRYVDTTNGSDASDVTGYLPQAPLQSIGRALELVNADDDGDGTLIKVAPGVYQETLPLRIEKNNISIVGESMRSCFVHPTVATENNDMFEVDSGSYIANLTLLGLKVPTADQGTRDNALDNDSTYGLPDNQPFSVRFRTDTQPVILKSPYIQNCTHFSDAHFDNANFDPNTFPSTDAQTYSAVAGDQTSAPCGGGLLVDGSAVSSSSPIRSMVVDAFTQITLDGPGILVTNNGYAQLVSFFGTFAHYHAKAKNGGQINLSNCVSDFGRYGLIADGKSPSAIATATASAANSGDTTITIGAITTDSGFHGTVTRPLDHMMVTIDSVDYGVVSSTANGDGWDIVLTSGLTSNITNTTVSFALRSYISTGGHTFEFVGVGTDYSDHPDFGGVPVEANQVIELNGGKVWQSSTDHVGKFKAGDVLVVDQVAETVDLKDTTVTGDITVTGTVDGRDVATDGTKLDGIEDNATADQTAAEIRTLVEDATDSNVFTDADHTKLDGIETGATADQTAAEIRTLVGNATDSNVFTDADHTKLDGIATGAEVNVNADWNATSGDAQILNKPTIPAAYGNSDVDTHLNQSSAATNEVLSWDGSDYAWVAQSGGGGDVVSDTTPQLGGDLDVNGNDIVSVSNGDIDLDPNGSGVVVFKGNSTKGSGQFKLNCEQNSHGITIKGPPHSAAASYTLTLPDTDGSADEVLKTDGSGNLSWTAASGGASAINDLSDAITNSSGQTIGLGTGALAADNGSDRLNTAVGYQALNKTTTGHSNVALGYQAMYNTGTGVNQAIAIGRLAQIKSTASSNISIGYQAHYDLTSGSANIGIGHMAGQNQTTGSNNVVIGPDAHSAATTASANIAIGNKALDSVTGIGSCTAIGHKALEDYEGSSGILGYATAVGHQAAMNMTSPYHVTVMGYNAATAATTGGTASAIIGSNAAAALTTGGGNTCVGHESLQSVTTGSNNVAIGKSAGDALTTGNNCIVIGNTADPSSASASNEITLGNDSITKLRVPGVSFEVDGGQVIADAYTETVAVLNGANIDPANGQIQTKTISANTTFTESLSAGESVLLMLTAASYTATWPTITWVGGSAPTLASSGATAIELWKVSTTLYGARVGDVA